jgi:L-threonylcarbamoyladenylate synthase
LLTRFWPGPLTLLMPRRTGVIPDIVTAGSALVAVRQSAHPVFRAVIDAFGRPLAAPSANRFGRISPTDGPHVVAELADRVPLVLDGGPTLHGLESTIVSVTPEGEITIWRHGPITAEALRKFAPVHTPAHTTSAGLSAPGQLPGHYAPGTPLILLDSQRPPSLDAQLKGKRVGLLRFSRHGAAAGEVAQAFDEEACLSEHGELREAAARLFAALRHLDGAGLDVILTELVPETGLGVAINERLRRAAAGSGLPERP